MISMVMRRELLDLTLVAQVIMVDIPTSRMVDLGEVEENQDLFHFLLVVLAGDHLNLVPMTFFLIFLVVMEWVGANLVVLAVAGAHLIFGQMTFFLIVLVIIKWVGANLVVLVVQADIGQVVLKISPRKFQL